MQSVRQWAGIVTSCISGALVPYILGIIEVESSGNPLATGAIGERGLMQLRPEFHGTEADDLYNPQTNIRIGSAFFQSLLNRYSQNIQYALAAYNAGPGRVTLGQPIPNPGYVNKVMQAAEKYKTLISSIFSGKAVLVLAGGLFLGLFLWLLTR